MCLCRILFKLQYTMQSCTWTCSIAQYCIKHGIRILIFVRMRQSVCTFTVRPPPVVILPSAVLGRADAIAEHEVVVQRHITHAACACMLRPRWPCVPHPQHGCAHARSTGAERVPALFQPGYVLCTAALGGHGALLC